MEMMSKDVVIVGGGIAGIATSLALKKVGVKSLVLERADELRTTGTAVTLAPNAWRALDALGVAHKLTSKYRPFTKGHFTDVTTGETNQVSYDEILTDSQGWSARAVHRRALLEAMAEELPQGTIRLSAKLVSMETKKTLDDKLPITVLHLDDGSVINAKVVIGCDGVHSTVAQWLGLSAPVDSGRSAVLGLSMYPQGHGWKQEVHQFLGEGARAGFIPLDEKQLYWFITYKSSPRKGEVLRDPEIIQNKVMEDYAKGIPSTFLDVVRHSDLASVTHVPLFFRLPWNLLLGQVCKGNVTVAGDAMHPMTPDLGQGACQALEDAVVLSRNIALSLHPSNGNAMEWEAVHEGLERYVKERRWRVAGVTAGAYIMGRAQQSGSSGWFMKFVRDQIFFRFVYKRIMGIVNYDSGKLPAIN